MALHLLLHAAHSVLAENTADGCPDGMDPFPLVFKFRPYFLQLGAEILESQ